VDFPSINLVAHTGRVGEFGPIAIFLASDGSAWPTDELILATGAIR
jgi:hypothetical protein